MKIRARTVGIAFAALVALALLAAVAALVALSSDRFAQWGKRKLEARLSEITERPVRIASLHFDPMTGRFEARGIVARAPEETEERPFLRVQSVRGRLRLRSLLAGRVLFQWIDVEAPEINIQRRADRWSFPPRRREGAGRVEAKRVGVRGGVLRLADLDTPLDLVLEEAAIAMSGPGGGRMEGNLKVRRVVLENPRVGKRQMSLDLSFQIEGDSVRLPSLHVEGEWLEASGSGEVTLTEPAVFTAHGSARMDVGSMAAASGPAQFSGELLFAGDIGVRSGAWKIDGTVRSTALSWQDWRLRDIQGPLRGDESGGIVFGPGKGRFAGGLLEGTVRLRPRTWEGRADFVAHRCELLPVLESLHHPLPLSGLVDARGSLMWPPGRPGEAEGSVDVAVARGEAAAGRWPVEGKASLRLSGEAIRVERSEWRAASGNLTASGEIEPGQQRSTVEFSLSSTDLAASTPLIGAMAKAVGLDPSGWRLEGTTGAGIVSGTARLFERTWTGEGTFAATPFLYSGVNWGEVVGGFRLEPSVLRFQRLQARRPPFSLTADLSFQREGRDLSATGEVATWEARDVLGVVGLDLGVEGPISGTFSVLRNAGEVTARVEASLGPGRVRGFDVDGGRVALTLARDRLRLEPLVLRLAGGALEANGEMALRKGSAEASVSWTGLELSRLGPLAAGTLTGETSGEGKLLSQEGAFRFVGTLSSSALAARGYSLGPATGSLETDFHMASLTARLPGLSSSIQGRVDLSPPHPVEAEVVLERAEIEALAHMARIALQEQLAGLLTAHLSVRGPLDEPGRIQLAGQVEALEFFFGSARFGLERPASIDIEQGRMVLSGAMLRGEGSRLEVSGWVDPGEPARLDLRGDGQVDLGVLQAFLPDTSIRGTMNVSLRATGAASKPRVSGNVTIAGGRLRRFDLPLVVDDLQLAAHLSGQDVDIPQFTAVAGGGAVKGSCHLTLQGLRPDKVQATLRGGGVNIAAPEGFRGSYSGTLQLTGAEGNYTLRGDVEIERGVYRKDFRLESFSLAARTREYEPKAEAEGLLGTMALDLRLRSDGDLWLKNDLGQVETQADLAIGGTVAQPELTGRIVALEGGQIRFRRVDYRLEEGTLEFNDPRLFNPYINIVAETRISEYDVTMQVFGTLDRLDYNLTSNPALPPDQIVSLLVTGAPTPLATAPGETTADIARVYLGGTVTGYIEEPIEKLLRLNTFRIDPLLFAGESDPTTRVTLGRRINPDLMVVYSRDIGGESGQIYGLEYAITRHLRAFVERSITGGVGGDLRYRTRFRLRPRPSPAGSLAPPQRRPIRPVAQVALEGAAPGDLPALLRGLPLKAGEPFSRRKMIQGASILKRYYVERGFLEARVRGTENPAEGGVEVRYSIEPGRRIQVTIQGTGRDEEKVRAQLDELWQEALFTEDLLEEAEREIVKYYRSRGYYTVIVERASEILSDDSLKLTFRVDPGEVVGLRSVEIRGNSEVPEERIRRQMLTEPSGLFSRNPLRPQVLEDDLAAIRRLYLEQGFLKAKVEQRVTVSPDGKSADVKIVIEEGERARVAAVRFEGKDQQADARTLETLVPLKVGQPYSPSEALAGEIGLRQFYDSRGYPDVKVATEVSRGDGAVELTYFVDQGIGQTVERVEIEGNEKTGEKAILRALKISPGQPVSREEIRQAQQRLYRLGIFEGVSIEPVPGNANGGGRIIRVRVREADSLIGGLGVGYDSESGPRATLEIADVNFRGQARYLGLQARASGVDDRLQAIFKDPRLFGRNWDSILTTFWEREEKHSFDFRRVGTSVQVSRKRSSTLTSFIRYNFNISNVFNVSHADPDILRELQSETGQKLEPGRIRLGSAGYALALDTRDSPFSPKKGSYLSSDVRVFAPAVGSQRSFGKVFLQGTWQRSLGNALVFATSTRLGLAPTFAGTASVPLVERFFGGGDNSVRGFPRDLLGSDVDPDGDGTIEDPGGTLLRAPTAACGTSNTPDCRDRDGDGTPDVVFKPGSLEPLGGEAMLILNEELRFPIRGSLGGVLFYDAGNTYRRLSDLNLSDLRQSVGLGLRLETPIGPVRLEYGRKLDRQPGEGRGQFYVSIGPAF